MIAIHYSLTDECWIVFNERDVLNKFAKRDVALKLYPKAELRGDEQGQSHDDRKRWARLGASWRRQDTDWSGTIVSIYCDDRGFYRVKGTDVLVPENATIEREPRLETFGLVVESERGLS
jgi:hypothetical protein